jgi:S1-C subfamily serine protease
MTTRLTLRFSLLLALFATVPLLRAELEKSDADPAQEASVKAVAKAMPAVVNINTESIVQRTVRDPMDALYNDFFGRTMRPPRTIKQKVQSLGSGFFIDEKGTIITNAHVVDRAAEMKISVTTPAGKTYTARYITGDPDHDLAMIKVDAPEKFPFISLNDLSPNLLGETCLVLGNPLGYGSSVARGILSAKGRSVAVGDVEYQNLVQTDAAINPGNSGGPVVDIAGRLIGISSVKMSFTPQGVPTQGIGFAIPGSIVREKVEEFRKIERGEKLPEKPSLAKKFFGITLQDVDEKLAASTGFREGSGALIADVEGKSPAASAGIQPGMLIVAVGRYEVNGARAIEKLLKQVDTASRVDFGLAWIQNSPRGKRLMGDTFQLIAR